jgi:sugar phosphate isomerase/epimerase
VIAAARMLRVKHVNTFVGNDHTQDLGHNFQRFLEVWPPIIEFAEANGIFVGIENCPMLFSKNEWPAGKNMASSPAIWREMFEVIPSAHFGLNYDPSHLVWLMIDYLEPLNEFGDRIFHVHAKDMKIDRVKLNDLGILSRGWSIPKIPGLGDIDWNRFISELTDQGYEGSVCVEVEDEAFRSDADMRTKALQISRNVLRPLIPK